MAYKTITSISIGEETLTMLKRHCQQNGISISSYVENLVINNIKNPITAVARKSCFKGHSYSGKLSECPYCRTEDEEKLKEEETTALEEAKAKKEQEAKDEAAKIEARKRDAEIKIKRAGLESDLARIEKWLASVPESEVDRKAQYIKRAQEIREQLLALNGQLGQENMGSPI